MSLHTPASPLTREQCTALGISVKPVVIFPQVEGLASVSGKHNATPERPPKAKAVNEVYLGEKYCGPRGRGRRQGLR